MLVSFTGFKNKKNEAETQWAGQQKRLHSALLLTVLLSALGAVSWLWLGLRPSPQKLSGRLGIGVILLNEGLWSLLLTLMVVLLAFAFSKASPSYLAGCLLVLSLLLFLVVLVFKGSINDYFGLFQAVVTFFIAVWIIFLGFYRSLLRSPP